MNRDHGCRFNDIEKTNMIWKEGRIDDEIRNIKLEIAGI